MGSLKVWDGTAWQTVAGQGRPGSNVFVGPSTPPGTPTSGDMWYDTDEVSGLTLPLTLANGGTGGTSALTARTSLVVPAIGNSTSIAGAPTTGTWARGDQWLDSMGVFWTCTVAGTPGTWMPPIGYEWAYSELTASMNITSTNNAAQQTIVPGVSRSYDGSPVMIEFYASRLDSPASSQTLLHLCDGTTNLGYFALMMGQTPQVVGAVATAKRRLTPTPGTHSYNVTGWVSTGQGYIGAGPGNATLVHNPVYLRVTRA